MSGNADASNLFAGVGQDLVSGTVNTAVYGTALPPTDATFFETALAGAYGDFGYVGEKGISVNTNRSSTPILDMDGNAIDEIQTDSNGTVGVSFMELNEQTLGSIFGPENIQTFISTLTTGTRTVVAAALGEDLDPCTYVFRMRAGKKRAGLIVPKGRLKDPGPLDFNRNGATMVDVTIKAIPVYDAVRGKMVDFYLFLDNGIYAVSLVPVISSVLPSGATVGQSVAIQGSRFTGTVPTTGVKFGGVNATSFTVVNDSLITAVVPAGSAGSAPVIVTNASGASAAKAYTRGA